MSWPALRGGTGWGAAPPAGDVGSAVPVWPVDERRRTGRWWLVAVALLLAATAAVALGLRGGQRLLPGPLFTASGPAPAHNVSPAARSRPLLLSIPAIELKVPLSEVGLNPNRTVQVPASWTEPGWYRLGPSPGQLGSATPRRVTTCPTSSSTPTWPRPANPRVQHFDSFSSPPVRPEFPVGA